MNNVFDIVLFWKLDTTVFSGDKILELGNNGFFSVVRGRAWNFVDPVVTILPRIVRNYSISLQSQSKTKHKKYKRPKTWPIIIIILS